MREQKYVSVRRKTMLPLEIPIIEMLTPKIDPSWGDNTDKLEELLEKFAEKYNAIRKKDYSISIPDNPMGFLRYSAMETLDFLELPVDSDRLLLHINTFHTKEEADNILRTAADTGLRNILVISGDGSPKRHRLEPGELGIKALNVTSVELLKYIRREYPDTFRLGVAFNQYEPRNFEIDKLNRKAEAGAEYIITQPYLNSDDSIETLESYGLPLYLGAWFSKNIGLLASCVDHAVDSSDFDPFKTYTGLAARHPEAGFYISMLGLKKLELFSDIQHVIA